MIGKLVAKKSAKQPYFCAVLFTNNSWSPKQTSNYFSLYSKAFVVSLHNKHANFVLMKLHKLRILKHSHNLLQVMYCVLSFRYVHLSLLTLEYQVVSKKCYILIRVSANFNPLTRTSQLFGIAFLCTQNA